MAFQFNSSQNNKNDKKDVNTRSLYQFMNADGFDPSTMVVGYWNSMLSIKMHPALPKEQRSEKRVYDYDKKVNASLTADVVRTLIEVLETTIIPAIESGVEKSVAIQCNADSLIVAGTGVRHTGSVRPFFGIHKGLDPNTKIPSISIWYEFKKGTIINDYNESDGSYSGTETVPTELNLFIDILKSSMFAVSSSVAHSIRLADQWIRDKYLSNQAAIASKVGADIGGGSEYRSSSTRVNFTSNNNTQSSLDEKVSSEAISSLDEMDDLPWN